MQADLLKHNFIKEIKCAVFDLDGTIYFGSQLADKANEVIQKSRESFEKIFFVTNNSARTRKQIFEKLLKLGIDVNLEEVMCSSYAIAKYLSDNSYKEIYCIGTQDLASEINDFGIDVESKKPQAVVVGFDSNFNIKMLEDPLAFENNDYKIIIGNKERVYPRDGGIITPGAGAIVAAVEYTLGKQTDLWIGKPNPLMLEIMTNGLNILPKEVLVIGDSFDSDVAMASAFGAKSILIKNGNKIDKDCFAVEKLEEILDLF